MLNAEIPYEAASILEEGFESGIIEENLKNPMTGMFYAFSVMGCMSSAMSEPGGAGLGTLGFNEQVAREMTAEAGFTRFKRHDFENAFNAYYEVRP